MEKITTKRSSNHTVDVLEPIIIEEKQYTRRVFLAYINDTKTQQGETVGGTIIHQRRNKKDEWEDVESINLAKLKAGEGVKIKLSSEQLKKLYLGLEKLYEFSKLGFSSGETEYAIGRSDEIIKVPKDRKKFISELLSQKYGSEIWTEIVASDPDLATRLSIARLQTERQEALKEFSESLKANKTENYWQKFFENNQWIFGYGLRYQFMTQLEGQPHYGGTAFTGTGGQKGDFLLKTQADVKFTVLVELKRPDTPLLSKNQNGKPKKYRNGAWLLGSELLGGTSQVQISCNTWERNSLSRENAELLSPQGIHTICPKGILVIGKIVELNGDREKVETFESYRRCLSNPEIITFDELYERARFIVEHDVLSVDESESKESDFDEVPF